ncbi:hypothetical protein ACFORL_01765 [Legionella dresdenensis]|uniref:SidE PDE domain-containing protein n=1 Tax=Legionella dresdenensis TaxID=450200 RepID=A0ABV8CBX1_9GAMM
MPKGIKYNPREYAETLAEFLCTASLKKMQHMITKAYNQYVAHSAGKREEEFKALLESLPLLPDSLNRALEIAIFFAGEKRNRWKPNSANSSLMFALLEGRGYKRTEDELNDAILCRDVFPTFVVSLCEAINNQSKSFHQGVVSKTNKDDERDLITRLPSDAEVPVSLFKSVDEAAGYAAKDPSHMAFCLKPRTADKQGQLIWVSQSGKQHPLKLTELLTKELSRPGSESSFVNSRNAKKECLSCLKTSILDSINVLIDPQVIPPDLSSTFVLKSASMTIVWYSSLGNQKKIAVNAYPELKKWLSQQKKIDPDSFALKNLLLPVDVSEEVGLEKKQVVSGLFNTTVKTAPLCAKNSFENLTRLQSQQKGLYILTKEPQSETGSWALYQQLKDDTDKWVREKIELCELNFQIIDILSDNEKCVPEKLPADELNKLAKLLYFRNTKKPLTNCAAVKNFNPDNTREYPPRSFVVSHNGQQWQLFYINGVSRARELDLAHYPIVRKMIWDWKVGVEQISNDMLRSLCPHLKDIYLKDIKTTSSINKENYKAIEEMLKRQLAKGAEGAPQQAETIEVKVESDLEEARPGRLGKDVYTIFKTLPQFAPPATGEIKKGCTP